MNKRTGNDCLSVIMPVYNEAATVEKVIRVVLEQPLVSELICVNDCSRDNSKTVLEELAAKEPRMRVKHHEVNMGKGAAFKTAMSMVKRADGRQ